MSERSARRDRPTEPIREAHEKARSVYCSPWVHREPAARGVASCENNAAELMLQAEIRSKARRWFVVHTTDSRHCPPKFPSSNPSSTLKTS